MTTIKNGVLELQEDSVHTVRLADNSAHEVSRRDGSMSLVLVCVNNQVVQLQTMLDKAKLLQDKLQQLQRIR